MHIAIAGNIGAGKTTLTNSLAKHYNFEVQLEDVPAGVPRPDNSPNATFLSW